MREIGKKLVENYIGSFPAETAELIFAARDFAEAAHAGAGQVRAYTGEPYIVHPTEVAHLLMAYQFSPDMVAAGFLHDVVEDTPVTIETIRSEFGGAIASLVADLTKPDKLPGEQRSAYQLRLAIEISAKGPEVQAIKSADVASNCRGLSALDPQFAAVYLPEKQRLLSLFDASAPIVSDCNQVLISEMTLLKNASSRR